MEGFYRKMLEEWEVKLNQASNDGDFSAWQRAEQEVENYRRMLSLVERKSNNG